MLQAENSRGERGNIVCLRCNFDGGRILDVGLKGDVVSADDTSK
jgi:hypothetical protein